MSYAIFSHHNESYNSLAALTWEKNKVLYAQKYNYGYFSKYDHWVTRLPNGVMSGFEKFHMAKVILETYPQYKWIWWTGTDSMITNMQIRMEDKIDNDYHFMMSVDFNGINADSLLIRNSEEGRSFINDVLAVEKEYETYWDCEQRALAVLLGVPTSDERWVASSTVKVCDKYASVAKIMPQKYMNSYNFDLYHQYHPQSQNNKDKMDYIGNWTKGDWLIHWPATNLDLRIDLANYYMTQVVE